MLNTQQCVSRHPPAPIDLEKWQVTADLLSELYNAACGTIVQFRDGEFNAVVASQNDDNFLERDSSWPWEMSSFCRHIVETNQGLYVSNPLQDKAWNHLPAVAEGPVRSYLGQPLFWPDGSLFGTICAIDTKSTHYNPLQIQLMEQLRDLITADLRMACAYEEIQALALTDDLTGVHNRRGLTTLGEQRIRDAKRFDLNIGLVFIDIDNMKALNDTHGHAAGDECILQLADVMTKSCRENDIIARVGGDEFVVMLLTGAQDQVELLCERIDNAYDKWRTTNDKFTNNTLSYGHVYRSGLHPITLEQMIAEADKLMYRRKHGRKVGEFEDPDKDDQGPLMAASG